ncbi:MAG: Leu/Ile/Val-binding protein [Geminicoccaceae bacterium]|jgi:branched-chain amino acid transport system substrate-binding protein|nr:Leu/Ile/Val-binding protein [Geminicoccaceae bacterium]
MSLARLTRLAMAGLLVAAAGAAAARAEVLIGLVEMQTGGMAISWQDQLRQAAELAVAKLNAEGGLLGHEVRTIVGDDACDGGQAVALANKFVSEGVVFVAGHPCSDASIPASPVYAEAGMLMISPLSTNPMLTERGLTNVFRVVGRDDAQGIMAGNYLADHWSERRIAVLHDGTPYVKGLAEETKKQLNARGVAEGLYEQVEREAVDYGDLLDRIQGAGIDVVYFPGRDPEVGLFIRQARNRGMKFQLVTGDNNVTESFRMIAGDATEGTLLTSYPDPRENPEAAELVAELRARQFPPDLPPLYMYATIQVWAQAVEKAGTFEVAAVGEMLREEDFDTVLGRIGFDDKGDVTGVDPFVWYVWKGDTSVSVDPAELAE